MHKSCRKKFVNQKDKSVYSTQADDQDAAAVDTPEHRRTRSSSDHSFCFFTDCLFCSQRIYSKFENEVGMNDKYLINYLKSACTPKYFNSLIY